MSMQTFQHIDGVAGATVAEKVVALVERRRAPEAFTVEFSQRCYANQPNYLPAIPLANGQRRHILHCSCHHRQCYVVRTSAALRNAFYLNDAERDPLKCPAHTPTARTYSQYVQRALQTIVELGYTGPVVWDCHDCPWSAFSHFDVTVLLANGARRMEIDGPFHFQHGRLNHDRTKDTMVAQLGLSLLRLSHRDNHAWAACMLQFCNLGLEGVWYSQHYAQFHEEAVPIVQLLPL